MLTPARNIDPAVGAEEWPSGTQVWNGNNAVKMPNPTNRKGKNSRCACNERFPPSAGKSKVYAPLVYIPNNPTSTRADPPISIKASFIAEYSFRPLPQIPINKNFGITEISRKKKSVKISSEIKKP